MNIFKIFKSLKKYIFIIILLTIVQIVTELFLPSLMSNIVDIGIVKSDINYIISKLVIMLLLAIFSLVASIFALYFSVKFGAIFSYKIRDKLYKKINLLSKADVDYFGASTLITRSTNDVNHVSDIISIASRVIVIAPIMGVGAIIMAIKTESSLSWIILVAIIFLFILNAIIFLLVYKKFELLQKLIDKLNLKTREILNGIKVIRAFNKQDTFLRKFNETNKEYRDLGYYLYKIVLLTEPMILLIINMATVCVLYFSLDKINSGDLGIGSVLAFIQYLTMILMSFTMLLMIAINLPRTIVSLKRIEEIYTRESSINNSGKLELKSINTIEFKNVYFKYPNAKEDTLCNINFRLENNKNYGIIGSSGSGKSTILNLILRFVDPTKGNILINDKNIKEYEINSIRNCIGYSPQKPIIFKGSIKENLVFDDDVTDEKIYNALDNASIKDLVLNKDEKLDYELESNIVNLSGGEKGRINIARTLLKKSSVYIFDDSFSAIDYITDKKIRKNLSKIDNVMKIFITQRIDTIKDCDEILLFDNGKLENKGDYNYLKKNSKIFKEFILSKERSKK